ncbi:hypothetical protein ES705_10864 [subsurface metagenome]
MFVNLRTTNIEINVMEIKILGPGCINCRNLEKATINALAELELAAGVTKEEDMNKIVNYGISSKAVGQFAVTIPFCIHSGAHDCHQPMPFGY